VFQTLKQKLAGSLQHSDQIITDALNQVFTNLGILRTPVHVNKSLTGDSSDFVEWNFSLGTPANQPLELPVSFNLGLPVLGLKSDSPMILKLGWGLNLGFGIDFDHGFFFVVNQDPAQPELHVDASVDLPDLSGNLLFLALKAEDKHDGDDLDVHFNLDLTNSGSDEKVGLTDLGNLGVNVGLTGNA